MNDVRGKIWSLANTKYTNAIWIVENASVTYVVSDFWNPRIVAY